MLGVVWSLQLKMLSQSAFDGLLAVVWPLFFATSAILIYRAGDPSALPGVALGGAVMGVWSASSVAAASALQRERRLGTLEVLVAAPSSLGVILFATTLATATVGLYSITATLVWSRFVFSQPIPIRDPLLFSAGIISVVWTVGALGFVMAVAFVRSRRAWALGAVTECPIWLACGFLVPLSQLPEWVKPISWLLGPTWGMKAVRAGAFGGSGWLSVIVCLGLTAIYVGLAGLALNRMVDSARRQGTLTLT